MATDQVVPNPRVARRHEWPWGEHVLCIGTDGSTVHTDGTVTQAEVVEPGTCEAKSGREIWLQLDGNRMVVLTETDKDFPIGIWFTPLSIVREKIVAAVAGERAMIDGGESRAMKMVLLTEVGGRKFARRAWSWRTRAGSDATTEWIDDEPLDWEKYCQSEWPKKPASREAVAA